MSVYLFTWHAYKSWLPDRAQGYVERGRGVQPPDPGKADLYRRQSNEGGVVFDASVQQAVIDSLLNAAEHQSLTVYAIATDATHVHVLVGWTKQTTWQKVQAGLRQSLSRDLNKGFRRRTWFAEGGSHKRVRDREHFDYLITRYLPSHRGLQWFRQPRRKPH